MSSSVPSTRNTGPNLQNGQKYNYRHIGVSLIHSFAFAEKQQIKETVILLPKMLTHGTCRVRGTRPSFTFHIDRPDGSTIMSPNKVLTHGKSKLREIRREAVWEIQSSGVVPHAGTR